MKISLTHTAAQVTGETGKSGTPRLRGQAPETVARTPSMPDFDHAYGASAGLPQTKEPQSVEPPATLEAEPEPSETTALAKSPPQVDDTVETDVDVDVLIPPRSDPEERDPMVAPATEKNPERRGTVTSTPDMQIPSAIPDIDGDVEQRSGPDPALMTNRDSRHLASQSPHLRDAPLYPLTMGQVTKSVQQTSAPGAASVPSLTRNVPPVGKSNLISNRPSMGTANHQISADPISAIPQALTAGTVRETFLERAVTGQMAHQEHATPGGSTRLLADPTARAASSGMNSSKDALPDSDRTTRIQAPTTGNLRIPEMTTAEPPRNGPSKSDISHISPPIDRHAYVPQRDLPTIQFPRQPPPQLRQVAGREIGQRDALSTPQSGAISGESFSTSNGKTAHPALMAGLSAGTSATQLPGTEQRLDVGRFETISTGVAPRPVERMALVAGPASEGIVPADRAPVIDRPALPAATPHDAPTASIPAPQHPRQPVIPTAPSAFALERPKVEAMQPSAEQIRMQGAEGFGVTRTDMIQTSHVQQTPLPHRADLAMQVARQMTEAVQGSAQRPVDIALNPEELGRVRLSLSASESGMVMQVTAERPETLDLMRRHIAELSEQFRQIGYSDISFSFAGGNSQQGEGSMASSSQTPDTLTDPSLDSPADGPSSSAPETGVDIRL